MKRLLLLAVVALLAANPVQAASQPVAVTQTCLARTAMVDVLIGEFGEQLVEVHQTPDGLLEFYVSPTEGSWTAFVTDRQGTSCVIAAGEDVDPSKTLIGGIFFEI